MCELATATCYRSITEIAAEANVAESTVVRTCKSLGFTGFGGLKLAIARGSDVAATPGGGGPPGSGRCDILDLVLAASASTVADCAVTVDAAVFGRVIAAVGAAETVAVVGVGGSGALAADAAYQWASLGLRVAAPVDPRAQERTVAALRPGDVCLAVSHSGTTPETLACVSGAGRAGATTAAVTSSARSRLAAAVDLALVAGAPGTSVRDGAMASRFAHLAVLDALYVGVALADPERTGLASRGAKRVGARPRR